MRKKFLNQSIVSRRDFLKGVILTGAAALTTLALSARAQQSQQSPTREPAKVVPQLNIAAETQTPPKDPATQSSSGGDFMAEVLNTLDIDYLAMNCASSFRGLHEAIINHTRNKPEILTCPHEEIAVSMAQGYAKIEGKPMAMICHGVVGLQHATMAIYNSWCDRVPVYIMIGNIVEADKRAPGAEWVHSAIDPAPLVGDSGAIAEAAKMLVAAQNPAVICDRMSRTPAGMARLMELAEALQCAVVDQAGRMNFPARHPLNQGARRGAVVGQADVILAIE